MHLLGGLEHCRDARAIVVNAGYCVNRVQVSTNHHGAVGAPARRFCDDVVGCHPLVDEAVHLHPQRDRGASINKIDKRPARGVIGSDNRDRRVVASQGWDQHIVAVGCANRALVEDHGSYSTGGLGVLHLSAPPVPGHTTAIPRVEQRSANGGRVARSQTSGPSTLRPTRQGRHIG
jgi:hypothetical protein